MTNHTIEDEIILIACSFIARYRLVFLTIFLLALVFGFLMCSGRLK